MSSLTRREMVVGLLATCATACASIRRYTPRELPLRIPLSAFDESGRLILEHPSLPHPILVSRTQQNDYIAVRMQCTHSGCPLSASRSKLVCHCHGSEFADDGVVLEGPAEVDLKRYPTKQEDDALVIDV